MKDPAKNPAFESSFSFTGTITGIRKEGKTMQLLIHQDVFSGRFPTEFKLIVPLGILLTEEFPYVKGDVVFIEDALFYMKDSEFRLRIEDMTQIRSTTAQPGEVNAFSFSGEIVDVSKEQGYMLAVLKQSVQDFFETSLELVIPDSVKLEKMPKKGDIGFIKSASLYDKEGSVRARIARPTYKVLYSPDVVMKLGTIEAKELFI